jgi:hypothetical protein
METLGNKNLLKSALKFYCKFCDYGTSKKSSFDEHKSSLKHARQSHGNILETFGNENLPKICSQNLTCENCKKDFKNRSGLWKHNKVCKVDEKTETIIKNINENFYKLQ